MAVRDNGLQDIVLPRDVVAIVRNMEAAFGMSDYDKRQVFVADSDHEGLPDGAWSVAWEGGVYDWTYLFPHGGRDEEYGATVADVSGCIPAGWFLEPINNCILGIYPIE